MPEAHDTTAGSLIKLVGGAAAFREFDRLLIEGYTGDLTAQVKVCADSASAAPSVCNKRGGAETRSISTRKGVSKRCGKHRSPPPAQEA
jgi:hypothetical protein